MDDPGAAGRARGRPRHRDRPLRPLLTRKAKVGLAIEPDGRPPIRVRRGEPVVTICGPIGECVLYVYGRKDVAEVTLDGPDDAVAAVAATPFGL